MGHSRPHLPPPTTAGSCSPASPISTSVIYRYIPLHTVTYRYSDLQSGQSGLNVGYVPLHTVAYRCRELQSGQSDLNVGYVPLHTVAYRCRDLQSGQSDLNVAFVFVISVADDDESVSGQVSVTREVTEESA